MHTHASCASDYSSWRSTPMRLNIVTGLKKTLSKLHDQHDAALEARLDADYRWMQSLRGARQVSYSFQLFFFNGGPLWILTSSSGPPVCGSSSFSSTGIKKNKSMKSRYQSPFNSHKKEKVNALIFLNEFFSWTKWKKRMMKVGISPVSAMNEE